MKFISLKNKTRGFTLIELLVVIAIIGILSSVVLASLSTARQKSRDAKRVSDLGQIQLGLELQFDANQKYPNTNAVAGGGTYDGGVQLILNNNFIPQMPVPPAGGGGAGGNVGKYQYRGLITSGGAECILAADVCTTYFLGATLERQDNTVLTTDADQDAYTGVAAAYAFTAAINTAGGKMTGFGANAVATRGCGYTAAGDIGVQGTSEFCYDIKP
jgi:prepilin-type N-terminal cleavage/methylation domain-containing protein